MERKQIADKGMSLFPDGPVHEWDYIRIWDWSNASEDLRELWFDNNNKDYSKCFVWIPNRYLELASDLDPLQGVYWLEKLWDPFVTKSFKFLDGMIVIYGTRYKPKLAKQTV